jgi:hypothetical protein
VEGGIPLDNVPTTCVACSGKHMKKEDVTVVDSVRRDVDMLVEFDGSTLILNCGPVGFRLGHDGQRA